MNVNDLINKYLKQNNYNLILSNSINTRIALSEVYENLMIENFIKEGFYILKNVFLYEYQKKLLFFISESDSNLYVCKLTKEKFLQNGYEVIEFIIDDFNNFKILQSNNIKTQYISFDTFLKLFSSYIKTSVDELDNFILNNINACNNILNNINSYDDDYIFNGNNENKIKELKLLNKYLKTHPYEYIDNLKTFVIDYVLKDVKGVINIDGIMENNKDIHITEYKLKNNKDNDFYINIGEYKRHQKFNKMGLKIDYFWLRVPNVNKTYEYIIQNNSFPKETKLLYYSYKEENSNEIMSNILEKGNGFAKEVYVIKLNLFKNCFNLKSLFNEKEFLNEINKLSIHDKIETFVNYTICNECKMDKYSMYLNNENKIFQYLGPCSKLNNNWIFVRKFMSERAKLLKITPNEMEEIKRNNIKYILLIYCEENKTPNLYGVISVEEFLKNCYIVPRSFTNKLNDFNNYINNYKLYNKTNEEMDYVTYFRPYTDSYGELLYNFIQPYRQFEIFFN